MHVARVAGVAEMVRDIADLDRCFGLVHRRSRALIFGVALRDDAARRRLRGSLGKITSARHLGRNCSV
jgi:hypothetical protein